MRYCGWGIRFGLGGERAYSVPGRGGKALRFTWRDGERVRAVVVTSQQPEALKAAIDEARGVLASASLDARDARDAIDEQSAVEVEELLTRER